MTSTEIVRSFPGGHRLAIRGWELTYRVLGRDSGNNSTSWKAGQMDAEAAKQELIDFYNYCRKPIEIVSCKTIWYTPCLTFDRDMATHLLSLFPDRVRLDTNELFKSGTTQTLHYGMKKEEGS